MITNNKEPEATKIAPNISDKNITLKTPFQPRYMWHSPNMTAGMTIASQTCQLANGVGLGMERSVTDDFADAPVEIDAGSKAEIDARRAQLGADHPTRLACQHQGTVGIPVVLPTDTAHWRDGGEPVTEALYPTTLVIHGDDEGRTAQRAHFGDQVRNLLRRLVVPPEQNQPAHRGFEQQVTVSRCQAETIDVQHHRSE